MAADRAALRMFETVKEYLDDNNYRYSDVDLKNDELAISATFSGDDLPMRLLLIVSPSRELVRIRSWLPFECPKDKMAIMAIAVCIANYGLMRGTFDLDISDGSIGYRLSQSYHDCLVGPAQIGKMMADALHWIEKYNDSFQMLSQGSISLEQFNQMENS